MRKLLMVICMFSILLGVACHSEKEEEVTKENVLVTSPLKLDTFIIKDYVCQIRSAQHIELRALEKGYLQNIYIDEGEHVKKGQLMFQIMPLIYDAELQKAKAEADFVEIEYENTKKLAESNIVSPNELALAKAKFEKAKAEQALAQAHLQFTEIRAPFDGIMDHFYVRLGSLVDEGDLLTTLSDNSEMWVYFNVPEVEYLNYSTQPKSDSLQRVNLLMANNQLFEYSGLVKTIEADFNNETGNIAFRATFPNPKGLLRHGETGNIQMLVPLKNSLIIPQKCTYEVLEKKYVFLVDENNIIHSKEISISAEMPDLYVIRDGLTEKERIVLEGIRKVKDNDKVTFEYESPKSVLPKLKIYVE